MTINRFCSSGVQAVALAADRIRLGEADVMIAGGTESMSMVPMRGNKRRFNPAVFDNDENIAIAYGMGITAEKVAAAMEDHARSSRTCSRWKATAARSPRSTRGEFSRTRSRRTTSTSTVPISRRARSAT